VFDEARVARGKKIATMYTQGIDSALKAELDSVSEKIAKLEATTPQSQIFGSDIATIETRIRSGVNEVIEASLSSDLSNLSVLSQELDALVGAQKAYDVNSMFLIHSPFEGVPFLRYPIIAAAGLFIYFIIFTVCDIVNFPRGKRWFDRLRKTK
jgi:hypothetical protein